MTLREFLNALRILRSVDRYELIDAGVIDRLDVSGWSLFKSDPFRWINLTDYKTAEKLWTIIEGRQPKEAEHETRNG